MKIEFDLNDSELFIPNGRFMNLKDKLGWADIKVSEKEIKDICFGIESMTFDGAINFDYDKHIKKFMTDENLKTSRKLSYNKLPNDFNFNENQKVLLNNMLNNEIAETIKEADNLLDEETIKNKLLKLNKLRLINGE